MIEEIIDRIENIEDFNCIPKGDMPGDKINIDSGHLKKVKTVLPCLLELLIPLLSKHPCNRAVVSVFGASGTGKSEIASLLSYFLNQMSIGSYTLSGDNYPHRIPKFNDAERLRVFRQSGIKGLIAHGQYSQERSDILKELQTNNHDFEPEWVKIHPWLLIYHSEGKRGLRNYLGTHQEIDFFEINEIISQFKNGADRLLLKRMGRKEEELWYESLDFSKKKVIILEWTHGNSCYLHGIDIPILLSSTPQETLGFRQSRNRDSGVDSPFTAMVLGIEQERLMSQASEAKLIVSSNGELISYNEYMKAMMG